jgi:hypothetical protein
LDPLLKDQQSRSAFDIHSYEQHVIGIVSESGKLVQDEDGAQARLCSFSEAVALKPQVLPRFYLPTCFFLAPTRTFRSTKFVVASLPRYSLLPMATS